MSARAAPQNEHSPGYVCRRLTRIPDLIALHQRNPERYPHLLTSVARGTPRARYDILFAFPGATLEWRDGLGLFRDGRPTGAGDFLGAFDQEWRAHASLSVSASDIERLPFTGGWFLYLGYELAGQIEPTVSGLKVDPVFPVAVAVRIPAAVIVDHERAQGWLVCEDDHAPEYLSVMEADARAEPVVDPSEFEVNAVAEDEPDRFLTNVREIQEHIRAGDVYQVNLSRGWRAMLTSSVTSAEIYRRLCIANPAPFAGLMTIRAERAVISSSPERLVAVRGRRVHTRPIAGTYPRSPEPEEDRALSRELLRHPKERAEHVMLIDLERNDLGRVCHIGTVRVSEFMALETYRHVHHIVSEVSGELRAHVTPAEVIRAVFPGGTITGCPKVRCMQIIANLERSPRGAYTGSMGYVNCDGSLDLNILIRTLVRHGQELSWRAGAGIVADSIPDRELAETRAKARGLLASLGRFQ